MSDETYEVELQFKSILAEYRSLRDFKEQMLTQQPFKVDERVRLSGTILDIDYEEAYGWKASKHLLQPGNTGTITDVRWNQWCNNKKGAWQVGWRPDVDWGGYTPYGGTRPTKVWIKHETARGTFYFGYSHVIKIDQDRYNPILPEYGADLYEITNIPVPGGFPVGREKVTYEEVLRRFGHASQ